MNSFIEDLIKEDLVKDEKIIWTGQPEISKLFSSSDAFLVPFSLLWGGFAFFWEYSVLREFITGNGIPFIFPIFGLFFTLAGAYFIFGRFIYKHIQKKNTYYIVTNKRVLRLTNMRNKNMKAQFINLIPCINKTVGSNGVGTISFGSAPFYASMYANSGMDFFTSMNGMDILAFYDINDVDQVYKMVNELRKSESELCG